MMRKMDVSADASRLRVAGVMSALWTKLIGEYMYSICHWERTKSSKPMVKFCRLMIVQMVDHPHLAVEQFD